MTKTRVPDSFEEAALEIVRALSAAEAARIVGLSPQTLRDYTERTGEPVAKYRFAVQVANVATDRSKSRIFPEQHHLEEMEARLQYEEECFGADLRGEERPNDHFEGGKVKAQSPQRDLFNQAG